MIDIPYSSDDIYKQIAKTITQQQWRQQKKTKYLLGTGGGGIRLMCNYHQRDPMERVRRDRAVKKKKRQKKYKLKVLLFHRWS